MRLAVGSKSVAPSSGTVEARVGGALSAKSPVMARPKVPDEGELNPHPPVVVWPLA